MEPCQCFPIDCFQGYSLELKKLIMHCILPTNLSLSECKHKVNKSHLSSYILTHLLTHTNRNKK